MDANTALLLRAVLVGAGLLVWYLLACRIFPYRRCRSCGGSGNKKSPFGTAYGDCRRCGGTGGKLRFGRHLWNFLFR